jgi:UDP-N-acetyl-D-mannosaminuronic acid dehydrogenase
VRIGVLGGAGHVGLPLSIAMANAGHDVTIVDINQKTLAAIESGVMPFKEDGAEERLRAVVGKTLKTSPDNAALIACEAIIIIIGTPVDEHLNPEFHRMKSLMEELIPHLNGTQTIILRSTIYPGTTEFVHRHLSEQIPGIGVAFCPERIAEGKAMTELYELPQIVSGMTPKAVRVASDVFASLTDTIITVEPFEAELAKLFTNSWRYIQFATANQFYMIAEEYGADFYRLYDAMTRDYPRTKGFPRPGFAAGPCLFKDTMQISAFTNNRFFLGHSAMLVNEGLPQFVVEQMEQNHPDLAERTVAILGMAFKAESDDPRESLSYKLRKHLLMKCREVLSTDEYVRDESFVSLEEAVKKADILVIGVPHTRYRTYDYQGKDVVDVWGITRKNEGDKQ